VFYIFDLIWAVINKPPRYTIGLGISGYSLDAGRTRTGIDIRGAELIGFDGHSGWSFSRRHLFRAGLVFGWIFNILEGGGRATGGEADVPDQVYTER
jgi:hypothetical protein